MVEYDPPYARAGISPDIALEPDEIRPTLELSPEQIAILEAEKRELAGFAASVRKSDGGRIRGEGTALDPEPKVVNIRQRLEQQRAAAGEPTEPVNPGGNARENLDRMSRGPRQQITANATELATMIEAAKKAQLEATEYGALYALAAAEAEATREALDNYLKAHGLA
jgi:hypothetical protein